MSIEHHPPDSMLAACAAGTLDHGQHVAIATHLVSCPHCRRFMRSMENVGGSLLATLAPAAMSGDAWAQVQARLDEPAPTPAAGPAPDVSQTEIPGLPAFVRRYRFGNWRWVAPSVHVRAIDLPDVTDTRVFLLRSGPGTRMLGHTHTGLELTCVLTGAFRQDGSRYGPGDFDHGDHSTDHRPVVEDGHDCICLVALRGKLRLNGLIGRIVQPFVRL